MSQYSKAEQKVLSSNSMQNLIAGVRSLNEKTNLLESRITAGDSDDSIIVTVNEILSELAILNARNSVSGGNIIISQDTPNPASVGNNDIWFDLNLIRR